MNSKFRLKTTEPAAAEAVRSISSHGEQTGWDSTGF